MRNQLYDFEFKKGRCLSCFASNHPHLKQSRFYHITSPLIETSSSKMPSTSKSDDVPQYSTVEHVGGTKSKDVEPSSGLMGAAAYGPPGIRGLFASSYVLGASFLASMGGFSFGYDQGVISVINVMPQFHEVFPEAKTGFGKGFMTGMLEFGAFLGCFFMPWLADKFSRKKALMGVVVIFNIGAIIQTAAVNYEMLVLGRTIGGIGVGTLALVSYPCSTLSPPASVLANNF
jgi:hypothetical protein